MHIPKNNRNFAPQNRGVAQLVVYLVWDQVVARSSRVTPTIFNCFFFAKSVTVLHSFFCPLNFCQQKNDNSLIIRLLSSCCDSGGIQTHNPHIRSVVLYSVELRNRQSVSDLRLQSYDFFVLQPNKNAFFFEKNAFL